MEDGGEERRGRKQDLSSTGGGVKKGTELVSESGRNGHEMIDNG